MGLRRRNRGLKYYRGTSPRALFRMWQFKFCQYFSSKYTRVHGMHPYDWVGTDTVNPARECRHVPFSNWEAFKLKHGFRNPGMYPWTFLFHQNDFSNTREILGFHLNKIQSDRIGVSIPIHRMLPCRHYSIQQYICDFAFCVVNIEGDVQSAWDWVRDCGCWVKWIGKDSV